MNSKKNPGIPQDLSCVRGFFVLHQYIRGGPGQYGQTIQVFGPYTRNAKNTATKPDRIPMINAYSISTPNIAKNDATTNVTRPPVVATNRVCLLIRSFGQNISGSRITLLVPVHNSLRYLAGFERIPAGTCTGTATRSEEMRDDNNPLPSHSRPFLSVPGAMVVAVFAGVIELLSPIDDNLVVPVCTCILLSLFPTLL